MACRTLVTIINVRGFDLARNRRDAGSSVNGDATGSFRVNLWVKKSLFFQLWENVSDLYTPAADTHLLHSLPAGAVYFGLFYRYIWLFHHR
jgi:hypothetical protein